MFTVSDNAVTAIRMIISRSGVPHGAGMRITADTDAFSLSIAVSPEPEPGDIVYNAGRTAQLFVAPGARHVLGDRTIDASQDGSGRVQFVLE